MKSKSTKIPALVEFLTEFAKYMISSGVSFAEFQGAARAAFLQAAMSRARLRNSRVNQSALAAITGLNRTQVRAILREMEDGPISRPNRLNDVLSTWQSDPRFRGGGALRLPLRGGAKSFSALIKKCCGDVSYKALLAEMKDLGYVEVRGGYVALNERGRGGSEPREMMHLSSGLAFTLRNEIDAKSELSVFTADAVYQKPSPKSRLLIKKRVLQSTKTFAAELKAAGEAEAAKLQKVQRGKTRSSILVLTVDQKE